MRAADCEKRAEGATSFAERLNFKRLASNWRSLAEQHQQIARMEAFVRDLQKTGD